MPRLLPLVVALLVAACSGDGVPCSCPDAGAFDLGAPTEGLLPVDLGTGDVGFDAGQDIVDAGSLLLDDPIVMNDRPASGSDAVTTDLAPIDNGRPPLPDAGTTPDPCAVSMGCEHCTEGAGCGWCANTATCVRGNGLGPATAAPGCSLDEGTWFASSVACRSAPTDLTRECPGGIYSGSTRDCSWQREAVHTCTAGSTVQIGCAAGDGCGLGSCTGDAMLRVCAGDTTGCAYPALLTNDGVSAACGQCPFGTFACPASGTYTVFWAAYSSDAPATCTVATNPGS